MRAKVGGSIGLAVGLMCMQAIAWTDLNGGDHGGSNWVLTGGTYIASNHFNIGIVTISTGTTVYVMPYDGSKYGGVEINASEINILGTLDASGAGYAGGNGGNGGSGSSGNLSAGSFGGSGVGGSGPFGGGAGQAGSVSNRFFGNAGGVGGMGGYAANGEQGDASTDNVVKMGSGGGGGGGGGAGYRDNTSSSGGGGGGAGNRGGGWVVLSVTNTITVKGSILTMGKGSVSGNGGTGASGSPGQGGVGGSVLAVGQSSGGNGGATIVNQCWGGGYGGHGGTGAGGGILLNATHVDTVSGIINTLGGDNSVSNGGTLKIFFSEHQEGTYRTGRTYLQHLAPPEAGTLFEF